LGNFLSVFFLFHTKTTSKRFPKRFKLETPKNKNKNKNKNTTTLDRINNQHNNPSFIIQNKKLSSEEAERDIYIERKRTYGFQVIYFFVFITVFDRRSIDLWLHLGDTTIECYPACGDVPLGAVRASMEASQGSVCMAVLLVRLSSLVCAPRSASSTPDGVDGVAS